MRGNKINLNLLHMQYMIINWLVGKCMQYAVFVFINSMRGNVTEILSYSYVPLISGFICLLKWCNFSHFSGMTGMAVYQSNHFVPDWNISKKAIWLTFMSTQGRNVITLVAYPVVPPASQTFFPGLMKFLDISLMQWHKIFHSWFSKGWILLTSVIPRFLL